MLAAIDPGPIPGWATFTDNGDIHQWGQCDSLDEFTMWLEKKIYRTIILEDFRILPHKAKAFMGSKMEVIKCIGIVESYCTRNNVELVLQVPENYKTGSRWSKIPIPSDHTISHQYVALNHGIYYLHRKGLYPLPD